MGLSETVTPQLHAIGENIRGAKRSHPTETSVSGWGQFLDVEGHKEQIGPYGTCSAILFNQIMNPGAAVEDDVVAQITLFWTDPGENKKLKGQNVRLAFLVASLARASDPALVKIRDEAVELLLQRQTPDGAWGDWAVNGSNGSPRQETTAWILLALSRLGTSAQAVKSAQDYLLRRVGLPGARSTISDFAAAVLIDTLDQGTAPSKLVSRARSALRRFDDEHTERIQFFDYQEGPDGNEPPSLRRDYLCYPAVLPFALLTSGMTKHARFTGHFIAARSRIALAQHISDMVGDGSYYILPGAARASTVDQAIIALAFESLRISEKFFDQRLSAIEPVLVWVKESVIFRLVFPIIAAVIALVAIQDPKYLIWIVPEWSWIDRAEIDKIITENGKLIRLSAAAFLFFANSIPGRIFTEIKRRWWK